MGKNNKSQKPSKAEAFGSEKASDVSSNIGQYQDATDVITGFDFLKNVTDETAGDSQIMICLKRMAKKDSITKIKALQDFNDIISTTQEDISSCLQLWSRCYCRLTMCGDHRVRELAQIALSSVIAKAGKQFASCVRIVLPYCLLSHADCVNSVAASAKQCLESSFNSSRRIQAIEMCKVGIFELINSIVKESNPYLSDKNLGLDEEEALRQDRLLAACLGAWAYVMTNQSSFSELGASISSAEDDNAVNLIIAEILSSNDFSKRVMKSDSPLVLTAMHSWIITLCKFSPSTVTNNSKLFLSSVFASPPVENDASLRAVDVGSWQSASALLKVFSADILTKLPGFEKLISKRLSLYLTNGPSYFGPPPLPFSMIPNIPTVPQIPLAIADLMEHVYSSSEKETNEKAVRRIFENFAQGLHKVKPYHSKNVELALFCETFACTVEVCMRSKDRECLFAICSDEIVRTLQSSLNMDGASFCAIVPYLVKLTERLYAEYSGFRLKFEQSVAQYPLLVATSEATVLAHNVAFFLNKFDIEHNPLLLDSLRKAVCAAIGILHSKDEICGNIVLLLVALNSEFFANNRGHCAELEREVRNLIQHILQSPDKMLQDYRMTHFVLKCDGFIEGSDVSSLVQILAARVDSLPTLLGLIQNLPAKYQSHEKILELGAKLLRGKEYLRSPREVTSIIENLSRACDGMPQINVLQVITSNLLEEIANEMLDIRSPNHVGKLFQCSTMLPDTSKSLSAIEILNSSRHGGQCLKCEKMSALEQLTCVTEIIQHFPSTNFLSEKAKLLYTVCDFIVLSVSGRLSSAKSFTEKHPLCLENKSFLHHIRDIALYSESSWKLLIIGATMIWNDSDSIDDHFRMLGDFSKFSIEMNEWCLGFCGILPTAVEDSLSATFKSDSDEATTDLDPDTTIKNLIVRLSKLYIGGLDSQRFDDILTSMLMIEASRNTQSWLVVQLLELVDEILFSDKAYELMKNFVQYLRSHSQVFKKLVAFVYVLNTRLPRATISRVCEYVMNSLTAEFDNSSNFDLWLLSLLANKVAQLELGLEAQLIPLLDSSAKLILRSSFSTAEAARSNLRLFSSLGSGLTAEWCSQLRLDESAANSAIGAVSQLATVFVSENPAINSMDDAKLDSTRDLAIFYNCCLRYTPKISNIDAILCALCGWITVARKLSMSALQGPPMESSRRIKLLRYMVAVTECVQTVHRLYSSSKNFVFTPSAGQLREFVEFYQLQYLDALIQLLITLCLPIAPEENHKNFYSTVVRDKAVCDKITYAIVSCLHKASSVDVIAHVHLEPLFCADESYLPEDVQTILGRLSPLIADSAVTDSRIHSAIYTVLSTLNPTLSGIYLSLSGDISQQQDSEDDFVLSPPKTWLREITDLTEPISLAISEERWRAHAELVSGYLYIWLLILKLAGSLPSEVRPPMVNFLRKWPDFQALLHNIFALAPANPQLVDTAPFDSLPQITTSSDAIPVVQHLSCYLMRELLVTFPAVVRSWVNDQGTIMRRDIVAYVSANLSPTLRAVELSKVRQAEFDEAIKVRAMTATGELMATYQAESVRLDLQITLPDDYPLSAPVIDCKQNIMNNTCKLWLRQLTALLICQNGALLDALLLWQKLITDKLGKLEECTICYSIVQGGNLNLPRRQCRTCRKKFHAGCLFKWFESSGNVTCPLCREQFY